MDPDVIAEMRSKMAEVRARLEELKAREPERLRLKIESELALERLHRANIALREAVPH
jgi:hypothetical protein